MPVPTTVTISFWHDVDPAIADDVESIRVYYPPFRISNPNSTASIRILFDAIPDTTWLTSFFTILAGYDDFYQPSFPIRHDLVAEAEISIRVNICATQTDIQTLLDYALANA
jgi:hypothetical protein